MITNSNGACRIVVAVLLIGLTAGRAVAADPSPPTAEQPADAAAAQKHYEELFGADERQAAVSGKSSAKFAAKLLAALPSLADDRAMSALVCAKAMSFGIRDPDGFTSALAAAKKIKELDPDSAAASDAKVSEINHLVYLKGRGAERAAAGTDLVDAATMRADQLISSRQYQDALRCYREASTIATSIKSPRLEDITGKMKELQAKVQLAEKARTLSSRLAQQPTDEKLRRQLMAIWLLDLGDPAEAARAAGDGLGAATSAALVLAGKPEKELADDETLTLARWYRELAGEPLAAEQKVEAVARAHNDYTTWLSNHTKKDAERLAVEAEVDLLLHSAAKLGMGRRIDRVVIWNTHNSDVNDRGTTVINVVFIAAGKAVWRKDAVEIPWEANKSTSVTFEPTMDFDRLRVEIVKWRGPGGGLDEIQIFSGGKNIAIGSHAEVSGSLGPAYSGEKLIDGALGPKDVKAGQSWFWLLPNNTAGWAEIDFKGSSRQ